MEEIKSTLTALAYAGIKTTTFWVVGYPGETETDFQETLALIEEMADDIFEADCSPFWYFLNAQAGERQWKNKTRPLYPEKVKETLYDDYRIEVPVTSFDGQYFIRACFQEYNTPDDADKLVEAVKEIFTLRGTPAGIFTA